MRPLSLTILLSLLTACAAGGDNYTQTVNNWRGRNASELMAAWGKPYTQVTTHDGNMVYTYQRVGRFNPEGETYSPSIGVAPRGKGAAIVTKAPTINKPAAIIVYCTTTFTAAPNGKIIDTNSQGSRCNQGE